MNLGAITHKYVNWVSIFWKKKHLLTLLLVFFGMDLFPQLSRQSELNVASHSMEAEDSVIFTFSALNYGNLLVGDYNNDNDYDILLASAFWESVPDVLVDNQEEEFGSIDLLLEDVYGKGRGQAWGDIDNDNDLDLIISGTNQHHMPVSRIYRNDGEGNYKDIDAPIERVSESAAAFGDLDNDGDQDLIVSGLRMDGYPIAKIYINMDDGEFVESGISIEGLSAGSILICDMDGDMDNDVVMNGYDVHKKSETLVLRNDRRLNFAVLDEVLPDIGWGLWRISDLNNDGRMDFVGADAAYEYLIVSIKEEDFSYESYPLHYSDERNCRLDLGDYDNDNDIDILLPSGLILENRGGSDPADQFHEIKSYPMAEGPGDAAWFSWFNDHKNDLVFSSSSQIGAQLYEGELASSKPSEPRNLMTSKVNTSPLLSWEGPLNSTTTMGITYNLRVGISPGGCEILSPMSDSSGFHKMDAYGNCLMNTSWELGSLPPGQYYWSVQAIDRDHVGSPFAPEDTFIVQADYSIIDLGSDSITALANLSPFDMDNDGTYDLFCTADVHLSDDSIQRAFGIMKREGDSTYRFRNLGILEDESWIEALSFTDYNHDGYVDVALSLNQMVDSTHSDPRLVILQNSRGEQLIEKSSRSLEMSVSDIQWFDYDNDGDGDFCLTGTKADSSSVIQLYRNDGTDTFPLFQEIELLKVCRLRTSMHDFTADGKMDLLVLGDSLFGSGAVQFSPVVKFFQSDSTGWTNSPEFELPLLNNHLDASDLNNDGYMDVISYGSRNEYKYGLDFYENLNGQGFREIENDVNGVNLSGFVTLGDHNQDNQTDIYLLHDALSTSNFDLKVFEREGVTFHEKSVYLEEELPYDPLLAVRSLELVDLDGDSDLDLIIEGKKSGRSHSRFILQNDQDEMPYQIPVPGNLRHSRIRNSAVLTWEVPEEGAHYYNVKVGTSPGAIDVLAPQSDPVTGSLRIPSSGNAGSNHQVLLEELPDGAYYWSVQAISKNKIGGSWSAEASFRIVEDLELEFEVDGRCTGESLVFINHSKGIATVDNWSWDFGDGGVSKLKDPTHTYDDPGEYEVTLTAEVGAFPFVYSRFVRITKSIEADFDYEVVSVHRDVPFFNLTDTVGIGSTTWLWDFGDNSSYSGFDPGTHYYEKPTTYTVSLFAHSISGCADSISKELHMCEVLPEKPEVFVAGPPIWYLACSEANHYQWYYNGDPIFDANESVYVAGDKMGDYYVKISNNKFCWTSSDVYTIPKDTVETVNQKAVDQVGIYPNPSKGAINLQMFNSLYGKVHIEIFSLQGSKVFDQSFHKESDFFSEQIEFYELAPGIYFISMRVGDALIEERLLIH